MNYAIPLSLFFGKIFHSLPAKIGMLKEPISKLSFIVFQGKGVCSLAQQIARHGPRTDARRADEETERRELFSDCWDSKEITSDTNMTQSQNKYA